jgi:hypothetical protein
VRSPLSLLLLAVLLTAPLAQAQISNIQALFPRDAPEGLSGGVELSGDWRTGSVELLVARGLLLGQWRSGPHTLLAAVRGEYGFAGERRIISKVLEHVRYRHQLTSWLSAEALAQHEYDEFRRLQLRAITGVGVRLAPWHTEQAALFLGVTPLLEHERLRPDEAPDAGLRRTVLRLSSYLLAQVELMENVSLVESFYIQPRVDRLSNLRILNETQLAVRPNARLTFSIGFTLAYDSLPPANVPEVDTQLRTALGVKF